MFKNISQNQIIAAVIVGVFAVIAAFIQRPNSDPIAQLTADAANTQVAILEQTQTALVKLQTAIFEQTQTAMASITPSVTPSQIPTPTNTPRPPTNTPTQIPEGTILIDVNFENSSLDDLMVTSMSGLWTILSDEENNHVFEVNKPSSWAQLTFGSPRWQNYEFKYKVRIVDYQGDYPVANGRVRNNNLLSNFPSYVFSITPLYRGFALDYSSNGNWNNLAGSEFSFQRDVWYDIQIEAQGSQLRGYINNSLRISYSDSRLLEGSIGLEVSPHAHIQFDDIKVTVLSSEK